MTDELIRDRVMVSWVELGEGWSGDWNPNDPDDEELLRFDVYWKDDDGEWDVPQDCSYCTAFPASATPEQREKGLALIMDAVYDAMVAQQGYEVGILERMSWINLEWLDGKYDSEWIKNGY
jgi:hypothetical protein